ncbi:glycosyl hydrolase family 28-related protein [Streptomyces sp. NPDC017979]|uniref:glycosyl hydrolase family 28-related protein n=1 Tax=Streptomyces sp. NPDC017979 TaxID=3365024 RepID=UPI0037A582F0
MTDTERTRRQQESVLSRRAALLGATAAAVPAVAVTEATTAHAAPTPVLPAGGTSWIDVTAAPYGAKGDDASDDGAALQRAFDACPEGGTVYLPTGKYKTTRTLHIRRRNITIRGTHAGRWPYETAAPSCIKPMYESFTGPALLRIEDRSERGDELDVDGVRLVDLALNGVSQKGGVHGLHASGLVRDLRIDRCTFWQFTGHGVYTSRVTRADGKGYFPKGWRLNEVTCWNLKPGANGFHLEPLTDAQLTDCLAGECDTGFYHYAPGDVTYTSCRSVFNRNHGYHLDRYSDGIIYNACSTDRNGGDGWHLSAREAANRPVLMTGCYARRDGRHDPGGGAGLRVAGTANTPHPPVIVAGFVATTGRNDAGDGQHSPAYGLRNTNGGFTSVSGGYLEGVVAGTLEEGGVLTHDASVRTQRPRQ